MKTILVVKNEQAAKYFEKASEHIAGFELEAVFFNAQDALNYVRNHTVAVVFLDIPLENQDAFLLIRMVRKIRAYIVFISILSDDGYFVKALKMKVDYFLMEGYSQEDVKDAVECSRCLVWRQKKRVYFRTFGHFDLFIDGKVIYIQNAKAKELLALCVDHRGGLVTMDEAVDKLWENRVYDERVKNLYRRAVMDIRRIFKACGVETVFSNSRGVCNINYKEVSSDYFSLIEEPMSNRNKQELLGRYLCEYSWAEERAEALEKNYL